MRTNNVPTLAERKISAFSGPATVLNVLVLSTKTMRSTQTTAKAGMANLSTWRSSVSACQSERAIKTAPTSIGVKTNRTQWLLRWCSARVSEMASTKSRTSAQKTIHRRAIGSDRPYLSAARGGSVSATAPAYSSHGSAKGP
jgi:hypothetical protein